MLKINSLLFIAIVFIQLNAIALNSTHFTQESLAFPREKMEFEDSQVLLFNGRGFVCPREFSMTSFSNPRFFPIEIPDYDFYINLWETDSGIEIRDDVPLAWRKMEYDQGGYDPLGCNFRSWAPYVLVTQDEVWYPNLYTRTGMFHKQIKDKLISFSMKTAMCVSGTENEVYLSIEIHNRDHQPLSLTLSPTHIAKRLTCQGQTGSTDVISSTPFEMKSEQLTVTVSSDIVDYNEKGYLLTIPSKNSKKFYVAVRFAPASQSRVEKVSNNISHRFDKAQQDIRAKLKWAADRIPAVQTQNVHINNLYYRCLLSVLMCRYERTDFIINPFWAVGTWPFTISWDNSFASDVITMLDPQSMKETLRLNFYEGKMKRTYISYAGASWDQLYIQEPFAQQVMIEAYLNQTGDISILNTMAGDASIYQWLKRWAYELHDKYGRKNDGLIDVGDETDKIIEIRTDGYNHVVPVVNTLTLDFYTRLAEWGLLVNDKEGAIFAKWAQQLKKSIDEKLWNDEKGWFDNLYPDGTKAAVWTYHLFDYLASPNLDDNKRLRLISHIKEGDFLGEFGFYSIARKDTMHWDRIDCDWGGGGQYAGMPVRIARNLYKAGNSGLAWDILKRYAKYTDYFPYISQNPSTDKPHQDISSMPLQIAAGGGVEAVLFGVFGLEPSLDGTLTVAPNYYSDMGNATMKGYNYRGNTYDVIVNDKIFCVYRNGILAATKPIGEKIKLK